MFNLFIKDIPARYDYREGIKLINNPEVYNIKDLISE